MKLFSKRFYYTYIIYSKLLEKHYCGSTQNLVNRLMEHNNGETKSIKKDALGI